METRIITNKKLIQELTGRDNINKILLHLDYSNYRITYEEDYSNFEITYWLPYYYKIKNMISK